MSCGKLLSLGRTPTHDPQDEQNDKRNAQQHNRYRGGTGAVVVLDQGAYPL
jgi:hypothetical protein